MVVPKAYHKDMEKLANKFLDVEVTENIMTSITRLNDNNRKDFECHGKNNNNNISESPEESGLIDGKNNTEQLLLNETIITLKLSKKHYKTAYVLAHMLGYESLDDYVSYILVKDVEKEIKQGEIDLDMAKLF
jgi:hypothetical protein